MTKNNYSAWRVDPTKFPSNGNWFDKLEYIARYAILAPSGHNSQPWLLTKGKDCLSLSINPDHHLSNDGSGLLSVEPYISLGTFIETFRLAALGFGYKLSLDLLPDKTTVATIKLNGSTTPQKEILRSIVNRSSNRNPYSPEDINKEVLDKITDNNFSDLSVSSITKQDDIEFLAQLTGEALIEIMSNRRYRYELSQWVRTNHTQKFDGMPGFTHGFNNLKALASKTAIRFAPSQGPQVTKSVNLLRKSGAVIIVSCRENTKYSFVNAGQLYARICIQATVENLASSALGAAVIDPVSRQTVKKHFKIKERPVYLLRLGKTNLQSKHSPRWPIEKILIKK